MRPAIEICVDSRAPLVPIGSLTTWTTMLWPSCRIFSIGRSVAVSRGCQMSATCRKAVRSRPTSMNADCMPGRMRQTRPRYTLPTSPRLAVRSICSSWATPCCITATRVSCGVKLIRISSVIRSTIRGFFLDSTMRKAPELLAPAGSLDMMRTACNFAADAIYAGQPRYSLRVRNTEFGTLEKLGEGIAEAHARGKQFFVVSNIFPHNAKLATYLDDMAPVIALKPDALIMSDPGLIDMVREAWPEQAIHLSVQSNTVNWAAVRFWKKLGLTRIILSRELSLDEVAEIRQQCPDIELEVFVHGALCIAYSGRCLLSGYFNHRDPNQGTCTNACRWDYKMKPGDGDGNFLYNENRGAPAASESSCGSTSGSCGCSSAENSSGYQAPASQIMMIEEKERPGEWMQMEEDEHGTYVMNSKDLRAIEHVHRLIEIGVDSLKIEGRTKSAYYVARTAQAYRQAIDDAVAGRPFDPTLLSNLENLANRGYTDAFYQRHHDAEYQNYLKGYSESDRSQYVGNAEAFDEARGLLEITVKNRFAIGDNIELIHPQGNLIVTVQRMENAEGVAVSAAPGIGHRVWIDAPARYAGAYVARFL